MTISPTHHQTKLKHNPPKTIESNRPQNTFTCSFTNPHIIQNAEWRTASLVTAEPFVQTVSHRSSDTTGNVTHSALRAHGQTERVGTASIQVHTH